MKTMKRLLALLLVLALVFALAGCGAKKLSEKIIEEVVKDAVKDAEDGGGSSSGSGGGSDSGGSSGGGSGAGTSSYSDSYNLMVEITDAMTELVNNVVEPHNAQLEKDQPDTYYNDPTYASLYLLPFLSLDMAITSSFSADMDVASTQMAFAFLFDEAELTVKGKNSWEVSYAGTDYTGENLDVEEPYDGLITAEYDDGAILFTEKKSTQEYTYFIEFIPVGHDTYVLQSSSERAIVVYKGGEVQEMYYSSNRYDYENPSAYYYDFSESLYPNTNPDADWVFEAEDLQSIQLSYVDGALTIHTADQDWSAEGEPYIWKDEFTIAG